MMSFARPFLLAFLLVPLMLLFGTALFPRRRLLRGVPRTLGYWGQTRFSSSAPGLRLAYHASLLSGAAAWCCLAIGLAGPLLEQSVDPARGRDADVMFAVDVSPSMAAKDLEPTRLETARGFILEYLDSGPGAAVGLVAFGADASLVCPPTVDYSAVRARLDAMRPGMLGDGTAIGVGLAASLHNLDLSLGRGKILVLLTDGEDNAGRVHPADVARVIATRGIVTLVLGLGTSGAASLDYTDPDSGERLVGTYRSSFDGNVLANLATLAGGTYVDGRSAAFREQAVRELSSSLPSPGPSAPYGSEPREVDRDTVLLLVKLACLFLAFAFFLRGVVLGGVA